MVASVTEGTGFVGSAPYSTLETSSMGGDLMGDLELLIESEGRLQRRVAGQMRRQKRLEQREQLQRAIGMMKKASTWRLGQACVNTVIKAAAAIASAYCQNVGSQFGSGASSALGEGLSQINPMGLEAKKCDRQALLLRDESAETGTESHDATVWLNTVRDTERKMHDRIEALRRAEHDGNMAAIGS